MIESQGHSSSARSTLARMAAFIGGMTLMVGGIAAGVTMVLLPVGIPLGLLGLFLVLGALFPDSLRRR